MHVEAFVLFRADVAEALHGVEPEHLPSHRRMPSTRGRAHCPLRTPSLAGPLSSVGLPRLSGEGLRAARAALNPCTDRARRDRPSLRRAGGACA